MRKAEGHKERQRSWAVIGCQPSHLNLEELSNMSGKRGFEVVDRGLLSIVQGQGRMNGRK